MTRAETRSFANGIFLALLVCASVAACVVLALRVPVFRSVFPWWFWKVGVKPLPQWWWLVPVAVAGVLAVRYAVLRPARPALMLTLLVGLGAALQLALACAEGRGLDGIRDRLVMTGHAQFVHFATSGLDVSTVARRYGHLVDQNALGAFLPTKPPGTLLFFMLTAWAAEPFASGQDQASRMTALVTLASWVYPVLTFLVLVPLYYLSAFIVGRTLAPWVCALYLLVPNILLMTLHLDTALHPLLLVSTLWAAVSACERRSAVLALTAGALGYLCTYVTFALLPAMPFALGLVAIAGLARGRWPMPLAWRTAALACAGFALAYVACLAWLGYDPMIRFQHAMAAHESTRGWNDSAREVLLHGFANNVEIAWWTGVPITVLVLAHAVRSAGGAAARRVRPQTLFTLLLLCGVVALDLFANTKGEVGRLWAFLAPLACISAVAEIAARFDASRARRVFVLVLALQATTVVLMKKYHDFY